MKEFENEKKLTEAEEEQVSGGAGRPLPFPKAPDKAGRPLPFPKAPGSAGRPLPFPKAPGEES